LFVKNKKGVNKIILIIPIITLCVIIIAWVSAYIYLKYGNNTNARAFQRRFNTVTASINIHEAVLYVENSMGDFSESYGYGGRDIDSPTLMASVTKMFTTACILKLRDEEHLSLDDKINLYIDDEVLKGLHIYKGVEYSYELTISDLLFQTSGLPDYFGNSELVNNAILNEDTYITFEQYVEQTKKLSTRFAPDTGKAYYTDINFDLLGKILEKVARSPLDSIYKQLIFKPLEMEHTYLPANKDDFIPYTYKGSEKLERPLFIASCRASGGCVSTARDMMTFNKAFWNGKLFNKTIFEQLSDYKRLQLDMYPIFYGGGYMRISLYGLNTFFLTQGELLGHSGSTGSFMFYYPKKDLYFVGDLLQIESPKTPIQFVMMLAMVAK
jgi:CubicO group peptidase (beta-lactamase class C family)